MTKTLYLHVGCHKTGSTSIQYALAENAQQLAQNGLTFFCENRTSDGPDYPDIHSWIGPVAEDAFLPGGFAVIEPDRLSDTLARLGTDVIVSSENFSFLFHREPIQALQRSLARNFDDIRVICYLRRQDRHAISHKQEGSKPHRGPEYALWGNSINPLPPYRTELDLYLNYERRMGIWADVFGKNALHLRIFEPEKLRGGSSVDDFFQLLGLQPPDKPAWRNPSQGAMKIILGHIITSSHFEKEQKLRKLVRGLKLPNSPWLPARKRARAFYDHYKDGNKALNERFSLDLSRDDPFSSDFTDYPSVSAVSNPDLAATLRILLKEIEILNS